MLVQKPVEAHAGPQRQKQGKGAHDCIAEGRFVSRCAEQAQRKQEQHEGPQKL